MIEFDPLGAEARARAGNSALDAAYRRKEDEKEKYFVPVVEYFGFLEEELLTMPIAKRYRRDKKPDLTVSVGGEESYLPHVKELNEADFKRADMLDRLTHIRTRALSVIGDIEDFVLEMEAAKRD